MTGCTCQHARIWGVVAVLPMAVGILITGCSVSRAGRQEVFNTIERFVEDQSDVPTGLALVPVVEESPRDGERKAAPSLANRDAQPKETKLPELAEFAELPDLETYAMRNNPGLTAAYKRWNAASERVLQVRSLPDPMFGYSYETPDREPRHAYGLSQTFPWIGKLDLRGQVALADANSVGQRFRAIQLELVFRVNQIYNDYYFLYRRIVVADEHLKLLASLVKIATAKYKTGTATHPDVISFQIELAELEDRLRRLNDLRGPVVGKLNAALGRRLDVPLPWPRLVRDEPVSFSDEQLVSLLRETNPRLNILRFLAQREKAALSLARKDYFPDVTVGITYMDNLSRIEEENEGVTLAGASTKQTRNDVGLSVSINLPIWQEKYRAGEREARSRLHASIQDLRDEENNLIATLQMAAFRFRDAERRINLYRDILIGKAEQSFHATQKAYVSASASYLQVIDIQRTLLEFKLAFERAVVDRAKSLAELEMLVGSDIRREVTPEAQKAAPDKSENDGFDESRNNEPD